MSEISNKTINTIPDLGYHTGIGHAEKAVADNHVVVEVHVDTGNCHLYSRCDGQVLRRGFCIP